MLKTQRQQNIANILNISCAPSEKRETPLETTANLEKKGRDMTPRRGKPAANYDGAPRARTAAETQLFYAKR